MIIGAPSSTISFRLYLLKRSLSLDYGNGKFDNDRGVRNSKLNVGTSRLMAHLSMVMARMIRPRSERRSAQCRG